MDVSPLFGSGCISEEGQRFAVSNCDDPDAIVWQTTYKPEGAADPIITHEGNGQFLISASVAGAYSIKGECCAS